MDSISRLIRNAVISGSLASLTSTILLGVRSKQESGAVFAATNAISHSVHGGQAYREVRPSLRHTATGFLIHHAKSIFWGTIAECAFRLLGMRRTPAKLLAGSAVTAATALLVDHAVAPQKLKPGFEKHLSKRSLIMVYGALAAGLAIGAVLVDRE